MPWPLFTPGKHPVPIVQEAGWAPGPVWTGAENLAPPGFDPRIVQPIASHYTDWATRPTSPVYIYDIIQIFCFNAKFSDGSCREKQNIHFSFNNLLPKSCHLRNNVDTYGTVRQTTDDSTVHALGMLDTKGYRHTQYVMLIALPQKQQWLCKRTLMFCLYVHCLFCFCMSLMPAGTYQCNIL
jgi:hypothetical protein